MKKLFLFSLMILFLAQLVYSIPVPGNVYNYLGYFQYRLLFFMFFVLVFFAVVGRIAIFEDFDDNLKMALSLVLSALVVGLTPNSFFEIAHNSYIIVILIAALAFGFSFSLEEFWQRVFVWSVVGVLFVWSILTISHFSPQSPQGLHFSFYGYLPWIGLLIFLGLSILILLPAFLVDEPNPLFMFFYGLGALFGVYWLYHFIWRTFFSFHQFSSVAVYSPVTYLYLIYYFDFMILVVVMLYFVYFKTRDKREKSKKEKKEKSPDINITLDGLSQGYPQGGYPPYWPSYPQANSGSQENQPSQAESSANTVTSPQITSEENSSLSGGPRSESNVNEGSSISPSSLTSSDNNLAADTTNALINKYGSGVNSQQASVNQQATEQVTEQPAEQANDSNIVSNPSESSSTSSANDALNNLIHSTNQPAGRTSKSQSAVSSSKVSQPNMSSKPSGNNASVDQAKLKRIQELKDSVINLVLPVLNDVEIFLRNPSSATIQYIDPKKFSHINKRLKEIRATLHNMH